MYEPQTSAAATFPAAANRADTGQSATQTAPRGARFCAPGPPGIPEKWTDAATNKHGYLLDLIRLRTGGASLRRAMEEALTFLSLPPSTPDNGGAAEGVQRSWLDPKRPQG